MAKVVVEEVLVQYKGSTKSLVAAIARARTAVNSFSKRASAGIQRTVSSLTDLNNAVKNAAIFTAARRVIRIADEFTLLRARIDGATESVKEASMAWNGLKNISKSTGADLGAAVDVFQRLSFVRKEINATVGEMLQFTETVSQLGIVSGASTGALRAGLTQLGQGLSSGVLRAEEFNSILENIPAVAKAISSEFGVTTGQLRNLVIDGKVLSQDVFNAILNQAEKTRLEFEKFPTTIGRAFANLKIRLAESIDGINQATSASKGLIGAMEIAGKLLSSMVNQVIGWVSVLKTLFKAVASSIAIVLTQITRGIQEAINFSIRQINRFRKEANKIKEVDFAPDITFADQFEREFGKVGAEAKKAGDAFKQSAEDFGAAFFTGEGQEQITKTSSKVKDLSQDYSKLGTVSTESTKAAEKAMKKLEQQTVKNRNAIADFIFDSSKGFGSLRDEAVKAIDDIARSLLRVSFGGKAGGGFFEQIGGAIGESLFGGVTASSFAAKSTAAAGTGLFGPGFATGGDFVVGGRGGRDANPVQIMATRGETVSIRTPQQQRAGGGGGATVNQTINISPGIEGTVRAEIIRSLPAIERQAVKAVKDAQQRGKL